MEFETISTYINDNLFSDFTSAYIDGKDGIDTVNYHGSFSNYSFTRNSNLLQISDLRDPSKTMPYSEYLYWYITSFDGTDILKNIEYIQFSDQTVEE